MHVLVPRSVAFYTLFKFSISNLPNQETTKRFVTLLPKEVRIFFQKTVFTTTVGDPQCKPTMLDLSAYIRSVRRDIYSPNQDSAWIEHCISLRASRFLEGYARILLCEEDAAWHNLRKRTVDAAASSSKPGRRDFSQVRRSSVLKPQSRRTNKVNNVL